MSGIGTKLMGSGFVEEGMAFEELEKKVEELKEKLSSNKPVCPHCHEKLKPFDYKGYYEEHIGWSCKCESIKGAEEWRGNYA